MLYLSFINLSHSCPVAILLEHYYQELIQFCARLTRNRDAAADLVQETYARVLSAQDKGAQFKEPRALLYRTARNLVIDLHRKDSTRAHYAGTAAADTPASVEELPGPQCQEPETAAMAMQATHAMLACITELPPRCRQAFILHRFDGLPHAEVARRMGISKKMVEQHIRLAMLACRNAHQAYATDTPPSRTQRARV